jgi:restriction endonuclease S subunit
MKNMNFTESRKVTLGQVSSLSGGFAFKSELAKNDKTDEQLLPIVKIGNLIRNGNLDLSDVKYYQYSSTLKEYIISRNDILVAMTGATLGKVAVSQFEGLLLNQRVARIKADETIILQKFLQFLLFSPNFYDYCQMTSGGGAQANISSEQIKNFEIFIPPIDEQHRIVKILDLAQSLIEKRKLVISYLDDYVKAVFLDMFGNPVSNPKGWDIERLGALCDIKGGKRIPKGLQLAHENTGFPYIKAGNIKDGKITSNNLEYLSVELREKLNRYTVEKGDVCITVVGVNIGDIGIVPEELHLANLTENANKLVIKDKEKLNGTYLAHYLMLDFVQNQFISNIRASGVPKLALFRIEQIELSVPPIDKQNSYASLFEKTATLKFKMQSHLKVLENNFQAQLQWAFRGE